jgi:hypothetical protein
LPISPFGNPPLPSSQPHLKEFKGWLERGKKNPRNKEKEGLTALILLVSNTTVVHDARFDMCVSLEGTGQHVFGA